jgi:hypothetical protein
MLKILTTTFTPPFPLSFILCSNGSILMGLSMPSSNCQVFRFI